jgi:hypothetical protein
MSDHTKDSEDYPAHSAYAREVRDIVFKSTLTGVAATMMAVTIFSPAGFGGMIGTSLASGLGLDAKVSPADDVYANLPAYPAPLSTEEVAAIYDRLDSASSAVQSNRAATEAAVSNVRAFALSDGVGAFAPTPPEYEELAVFASVSPAAPALEFAAVEFEPTLELGPDMALELVQEIAAVDYSIGDEALVSYDGANLELSEMFDAGALYNPAS